MSCSVNGAFVRLKPIRDSRCVGHGALLHQKALTVVRRSQPWNWPYLLVPDVTAAAEAAGADGLILEVHPDPERAMSDGYQSLNFPQFEATMAKVKAVAAAVGKSLG